jgi:hypothetical protein
MEKGIHDEYFGEIRFDDTDGCYSCEIEPWGDKISVSFIVDLEDADIARVVHHGKTICRDLFGWVDKAKEFATGQLLELKNQSWLEEEEEITELEFKGRMLLNSIVLYDDGNFDFRFDDDDMFCGRSIQLSGNIENDFENVAIMG